MFLLYYLLYLHQTISFCHPIEKRRGRKIAVRVISQFGEESTKVLILINGSNQIICRENEREKIQYTTRM